MSRKQKREPKCLGVGFPLTPGCSVASICSAVPQTLNHSPLAPRLLRPSLGGAKLLTTSKARQSRTEEPRRASAQPRCARRSSCPSTRPALHPLSSKGLRRVPAYRQPGAEPSRAAPPARSEKDSCPHLRGVMGWGASTEGGEQVAWHFSGDSARGRELRTGPHSSPCSTPPGWRGGSPGPSTGPSWPGRRGCDTGQSRGQSLHPSLGAGAALYLSLLAAASWPRGMKGSGAP